MTRAAQSVSLDDQATQAKFGHLHIVFRDWQAVGSNANSTFRALFDMEDTPASATRDQIRADVMDAFSSIRVWLFDAPTERVQDLKTKLSLEKTTSAFRGQVSI